jgi:hypothetical protein
MPDPPGDRPAGNAPASVERFVRSRPRVAPSWSQPGAGLSEALRVESRLLDVVHVHPDSGTPLRSRHPGRAVSSAASP